MSESELLEALASAMGDSGPEDAKTINEMAEMHGSSVFTIKRALKALQKQGRLLNHNIKRMAINGRMVTVVGYTIKPAPKKR